MANKYKVAFDGAKLTAIGNEIIAVGQRIKDLGRMMQIEQHPEIKLPAAMMLASVGHQANFADNCRTELRGRYTSPTEWPQELR